MRDTRTFDRQSRTLNAKNAAPVVIPLAVLLIVIVFILTNRPGADRPAGRGISSYGFDLTPLLIGRDQLIGTDAGKGGTPALDNPATAPASEIKTASKLAGINKLVSSDRVIGVTIADDARAYPLWVMEAHEVCNDSLGGRAIAVTYNPLCDSAVVFDRLVGDQTLTFGASGMLYNSNLLMYDRRDNEGESLWSQLQFRAVSGPAAAQRAVLTVLPCALVTWEKWKSLHPQTTVALPNPARRKAYRPNAFARYFSDDALRYDVDPLPPSGSWRLKTPIVAIRDNDAWRVMPADQFGGGSAAGDQPVVFAFWFAWYAMHPDSRIE